MAVFEFDPSTIDADDSSDEAGQRILDHQTDLGTARRRTLTTGLVRVVGENICAIAISHPAIVGSAAPIVVVLPGTTRRKSRTQFGVAVIASLASGDVLRNDDAP